MPDDPALGGETMVSRVARAISSELGLDYDKVFTSKREWIDARGMRDGQPVDINEPRRDDLDDAARAAIAAMREPTLEMLDEGHRTHRRTQTTGVSGMTIDAQLRNQCAREAACWRAMIDAALAEDALGAEMSYLDE